MHRGLRLCGFFPPLGLAVAANSPLSQRADNRVGYLFLVLVIGFLVVSLPPTLGQVGGSVEALGISTLRARPRRG